MAGSLIDTLSGDFDPSQYKDSYREALQEVIEAKIAGHAVKQPEQAQPTAGTVVDLMAALRASVEAAKAGRPGGGDSSADRPAKATAKKGPPKAAPARKGTARKGAAGKSTRSGKSTAKTAKASTKTAPKKVAARKSA